MDPTDYDYKVFRVCSEISKQVFPLTLDIDNPRLRKGFERLAKITTAMGAAKAKGGAMSALARVGLGVQAAATYIGLYCLPTESNAAPANVRLSPVW
jgi:magnesium-protoporphyrin IX monomethyl ester (oxidative) cyclase